MSEFKGTKGKWNQNRSCVFIGESEKVDNNVICRLHRGTFNYMDEEMEANALLISKAPEMLEMLKSFVDNNMLSVVGEEMAVKLIKQATEI